MVELTLTTTEIVMTLWAGLATAAWLSAKEDARVAKKMLVLFIENPDARKQILDAHEKFVRENQE